MSVVMSQMPLAPGDHLLSSHTPAMAPSINPLAPPFKPSGVIIQPATNGTGVRRLSTGAALAEAVGIDLNAIGKAEAKKIMSIEHKVLGFRPPQGSFAAEAQAAAAKHPEVPGTQLDVEKLKEAAKIDAQRILAERNQSTGSGSPTSSAIDKSAVALDDEDAPDVDLSTLSEADARKLMSHEHRALGFRPPPGSLAAEAQALVAKTTEEKSESTQKRRRMSNDGKPRVHSNESSPTQSRRGSTDFAAGPKVRRASNELAEIKRSSSDEGIKTVSRSASTRRKSVNVSELSAMEKEVLLREIALRDAERIKTTRGINGECATESSHIETKDLPGNFKTSAASPGYENSPKLSRSAPLNLPGPVQEVQKAVADILEPAQPAVDSDTQRVPVTSVEETVSSLTPVDTIPEQDEEVADESKPVKMLRTETEDSVQIVGDILA